MYPHSYDELNDSVLVIDMTRDAYAAASFLDQRILTPQTRGQWLAADPVDKALEVVDRSDCDFIFHIGHVGSTLLSRLIGALPGVLALREPAALRTLAQLKAEISSHESVIAPATFERRLTSFVKLWSRTYAPTERSIVKATSFASELAGDLMARNGGRPSIALTVAPETYIAGILGGEGSRQELQVMAPSRLKRLHARLGRGCWRLYELSDGERAAMSWTCEMLALRGADAGRLRWIDFEAFLRAPSENLAGALRHIGVPATSAEIEALTSGPLMQRYSKAPEHAYSPQLRAQLLEQSRREEGDEIRRGLAWLDAAAKAHPSIATAIA